MDGVRKNEREVHEVKCFRNGVNLFRKAILIKRTFLRCGVLSLFSRSSLGVPRRNKARYKNEEKGYRRKVKGEKTIRGVLKHTSYYI